MNIEIKNSHDLYLELKKRRKTLGISQGELAKFCNLTVNGISKIELEKSDIKFSTFLKIASLLSIKISIGYDE